MASKPFHHGNLRAVLLEQAEAMLRESGVDALSLRELARQAGVSHGAPRSHFIDRRALLDALAEQGFNRLADNLRSQLRTQGTLEERARRVGRAYVDFAVEDAALMHLMFASKLEAPSRPVLDAAARLFQVFQEALGGASPGAQPQDDTAERFKLLFVAAMQGTATLLASRRISREQAERVIDDAVDALLTSDLGVRRLSG
jgi:AcrR family transcriptional regulator